MTNQEVTEVIRKEHPEYELLGDPSLHDGKWRALVIPYPSGPLLLMEFTIKEQQYE